MIVDFYQIGNCTYELYNGRHVIFAPSNVSEDLLYTYRFFRTEDGRACHFLTPDEYYHVMNNMSTGRAVFGTGNQMPMNRPAGEMPSEYKGKNVTALCFISLTFLISSLILFSLLFDNNAVQELLSGSFTCFIISFILSIVARVRNKKSVFALVLLILHIILTVLLIIGIVMAIITCGQMIDSCADSFT